MRCRSSVVASTAGVVVGVMRVLVHAVHELERVVALLLPLGRRRSAVVPGIPVHHPEEGTEEEDADDGCCHGRLRMNAPPSTVLASFSACRAALMSRAS